MTAPRTSSTASPPAAERHPDRAKLPRPHKLLAEHRRCGRRGALTLRSEIRRLLAHCRRRLDRARSAGELGSPHIRACGRSLYSVAVRWRCRQRPATSRPDSLCGRLVQVQFDLGFSRIRASGLSAGAAHAPLVLGPQVGRRRRNRCAPFTFEDPACRIRSIAMPQRHPAASMTARS